MQCLWTLLQTSSCELTRMQVLKQFMNDFYFQVNRPIAMKKDGIQTRKRKPKSSSMKDSSKSKSGSGSTSSSMSYQYQTRSSRSHDSYNPNIEDHRKYQIEEQEQLIMYSNQDPVLASSSSVMLKHNSRTGSPLASPGGVISETIVLPPGAIALDRAMISK